MVRGVIGRYTREQPGRVCQIVSGRETVLWCNAAVPKDSLIIARDRRLLNDGEKCRLKSKPSEAARTGQV